MAAAPRAWLAIACLAAAGCTGRSTSCEQGPEWFDVRFAGSGVVGLRIKPDAARLIGNVHGQYAPQEIKELRIDSSRVLSLTPKIGATIKVGKLTEECAAKLRKVLEPWGKLKEGDAGSVATNPA